MRIEDHLDRMLDEALDMTFPASDPISVYMPDIEIDDKAERRKEAMEALPAAV